MPGVNLGDLISRAAKKGILLSGGGHAMAAGLSIDPSRLAELRDFLEGETKGATFELAEARVLEIDGALGPGAANAALLDMVERVGPFGSGAPEPLFAVPNVRAAGARRVGENHVAFDMVGEDGSRLRAIAFRAADGPEGARDHPGRPPPCRRPPPRRHLARQGRRPARSRRHREGGVIAPMLSIQSFSASVIPEPRGFQMYSGPIAFAYQSLLAPRGTAQNNLLRDLLALGHDLYCGVTSNLIRRVWENRNHEVSGFTADTTSRFSSVQDSERPSTILRSGIAARAKLILTGNDAW